MRDGGDRLLSDDELDGYGDASINVAVLPEMGDGSATDDEFGKRPPRGTGLKIGLKQGAKAANKKKRKPKGPKKNARKVGPGSGMGMGQGLAARMNGM
jgi:hypothetical protein